MRAVDIIVKKRDGAELTAAEIEFFIDGFTDGSIPDYQATAWAMAIYFQGMCDAEATALTLAMLRSGQQLDPHVYFPPGAVVVDKHSTGGVGDKTTLALAPLVASLGLPVGKLSGRGLGYSGGTIDKLESISGFTVQLSNEAFVHQLHEVGLVIGSQTADLAPADGKLYALRDVSGTVPVLPLIASSIMSKKLASGADAIVLNVKVGHGAFMKTQADARRLARLMVEIGRNAGRRMSAVISAMDEPLGRAVGNALELKEAIATLQGNGPSDFEQLVVTLAAQMLSLGGLGNDELLLQNQAREQLRNGQAWNKFRQFIDAQGGDVRQIDDPELLPSARLVEPIRAPAAGWLAEIRADVVGLATVELGGGRQKKGDSIDYAVGIVLGAKVGDQVELGQPLCWVHANDSRRLSAAQAQVLEACRISPVPILAPPLVYELIS